MPALHAPDRPLISCDDEACCIIKVVQDADAAAVQKVHPPRSGERGRADTGGDAEKVDPPAREDQRYDRGGYFYYSAFPPPLPPLLKTSQSAT